MSDLEREALRCVEDGPVKRPYLSLIRNRRTWSDLRLADGEQYTVGERVDAVELTPEVRAALAAREDTKQPEELHEEMLDLLEEAIWAVGVNPLAGKIQAILLKYGR